MPSVMIWHAVECKWACLVPYYNSFICYYYHFEHLFLLNQITLNVYTLMLCLLVVNFTFINVLLLCGFRKGWGRHMLMIVYGSESFIYLSFI